MSVQTTPNDFEKIEWEELRHETFWTTEGEPVSKTIIEQQRSLWWSGVEQNLNDEPARRDEDIHDFSNDPLAGELKRHNLDEAGVPGYIPHAQRVRKRLKKVLMQRFSQKRNVSRDLPVCASEFLLPCHQVSLQYPTTADVPLMSLPPMIGQDADRDYGESTGKLTCYFSKGRNAWTTKEEEKQLYNRHRYFFYDINNSCPLFSMRMNEFCKRNKTEAIGAKPSDLHKWHAAGRHIHGFFQFIVLKEQLLKVYLLDIFNGFIFPFYIAYERWPTKFKHAFDILTAYNLHLTQFILNNKEKFLRLDYKTMCDPYNLPSDQSGKVERKKAIEAQNEAIFGNMQFFIGGYKQKPTKSATILSRNMILFTPKSERISLETQPAVAGLLAGPSSNPSPNPNPSQETPILGRSCGSGESCRPYGRPGTESSNLINMEALFSRALSVVIPFDNPLLGGITSSGVASLRSNDIFNNQLADISLGSTSGEVRRNEGPSQSQQVSNEMDHQECAIRQIPIQQQPETSETSRHNSKLPFIRSGSNPDAGPYLDHNVAVEDAERPRSFPSGVQVLEDSLREDDENVRVAESQRRTLCNIQHLPGCVYCSVRSCSGECLPPMPPTAPTISSARPTPAELDQYQEDHRLYSIRFTEFQLRMSRYIANLPILRQTGNCLRCGLECSEGDCTPEERRK